MTRILTVGFSPTIQNTVNFASFEKNRVNRSERYRLDASGKAVNAARVLQQIEKGCATAFCPLGTNNADEFLALAAPDGLSIEWVPVPGSVRHCYTLLETESGQATELVVGEPVDVQQREVYEQGVEILIERIASVISTADAILVAGSCPAEYPADTYARICRLARDAGRPVMADFRGKELSLTLADAVPDIVKINEEEFCSSSGLDFPQTPESLLDELAEKSATLHNTLVITRGTDETLAASCGTVFRQPVNPVTPVNVIGCGDSFSAGFLHEWVLYKKNHNDNTTYTNNMIKQALSAGEKCAGLNAMNIRPGAIISEYIP